MAFPSSAPISKQRIQRRALTQLTHPWELAHNDPASPWGPAHPHLCVIPELKGFNLHHGGELGVRGLGAAP